MPNPTLFIKLFVFIFSLFIGSFLNVVVFRLHSGESIVFGHSHCLACNKKLSWYELIPVLSFLLQRGKCRSCGSALSWQYPLVELATGALFYFSFVSFSTIAYFSSPLYPIFIWAVCSICLVIFVYDLRYYLIPDACIVWGSATVFVAGFLGIWRVQTVVQLFSATPIPQWEYILSLLATACLCALPFFLIVFLSRGQWMGFGDVKLAFFMGMVLGLHAYLAIFVGVISGAIIGLALIATGKAGMKTVIPFGPFLILGTLVVLFWGQAILDYAGGYVWLPLG